MAMKHKLTSPGERLKYIRAILRLSRGYVQEKYSLPEVTLKAWENGLAKLTSKGLARCLEVYCQEGLVVDENWVLTGVGVDPIIGSELSEYFASTVAPSTDVQDEGTCMVRDARLFKESYVDAVILQVHNNEMSPFYHAGDFVGGRMRPVGALPETAFNKDCIVALSRGELLLRRVIKTPSGSYNLACLNPLISVAEPVLYNVEVALAAPVIWHRRKEIV